MLEKTFKITKSNCKPNTAKSTKLWTLTAEFSSPSFSIVDDYDCICSLNTAVTVTWTIKTSRMDSVQAGT